MNNKILLPEIVVSSSELYYALFLHLLGLGLTILSSQASVTFEKKKKQKQKALEFMNLIVNGIQLM